MTMRKLAALTFVGLHAVALNPALGQGLPRARPEEVGLSSERLERLTSAFQSYVNDKRLSGAVIVVARDGKIAYQRAFGSADVESRTPMRDDAIFRIASQSKALVSVATMMLQEDGLLLLGDPVSKFLPEFARTKVAVAKPGGFDIVDARRPITIRDLLTHTAGVSYGSSGPARQLWADAKIQGWYFADRKEPIGATVSRMAELPFDAQPGEQWVYGYSTDILGALLEKASGMTLDQLLRTRILAPLRMNDTHFYLPPEKRNRLTTVYSATADGRIERAPADGTMNSQGAYADGPRASFSGGAGLLSTALDYTRFLQMLLNGGTLDGARILSPKSVQLMTVNHVGTKYTAPGTGFGLGFSVVTDLGARGLPGSVGEYGWGGAYHSSYWVDPVEKLVVVYFTQLIPARTIDDHAKLRALIYQAITRSNDAGRNSNVSQ